MAQHDYDIANQSFPSFRSDLNSVLEAINTSNSGTSRPTSAVAGTIWLDTTSASTPTLKFYDGSDDISLATLDYTANTVNWLDSTVTISSLSQDLDVNGNSIISSANGNITFTPDGTGKVIIDGLSHPTSDGTSGQFMKTDGAGNLSFGTVDLTNLSASNLTSGTVPIDRLGTSGTKDATTFLRGDNTFATAGGDNTPAFEATLSSNFTFTSATDTKVPFATETFDTDSDYDSSTNYRFTPQTAGKYLVYLWMRHNPSGTNNISNAYTFIKKNGTTAAAFYQDHNNDANVLSVGGSRVIDFNGSTDYVEAYVFQTTGGTPQIDTGTYTYFGAYKLIGV